jgi:anti-sigma factor RsiW
MSDWIEKIHAHADGEPVDAAEVQQLMDSDPRAAAEHQWAVYIRELLRSKHVPVDSSLAWQKAKERLDAIDALEGDSRVGSFVAKHGWAFAAVLFVVILFAGFMNRGSSGPLSSQELAGIFSSSPVTQEVDARTPGTADQFAAQNNFNDIPRVEPVVHVLSAGVGVHEGIEFLRLQLQDNTGPLMMFVFRSPSGFGDFEAVPGRSDYVGGRVNGQTVVGWNDEECSYLLICERSTEELVSIADQMRR